MKYFGLYCPGQEKDIEKFNKVKSALCNNVDRFLFEDKKDCEKAVENIKVQLKEEIGLKFEWLNDWDNDKQESVVFSVSRSNTMPYAIGYLHFYKSKN